MIPRHVLAFGRVMDVAAALFRHVADVVKKHELVLSL
jgi:hypothetical protein